VELEQTARESDPSTEIDAGARVVVTYYFTSCCSLSLLTSLLLTPTSKAFIRVCLCVILSVCPHDNSKTNDSKVFKLGTGNDLGIAYRWYDYGVKRSKVRVKVRVAKTS